jgi:uncharacterized protein (DUF934 family)
LPEIIRLSRSAPETAARVEQDDWDAAQLLTLAQWKEKRAAPTQAGERVGVRLEPADDPAELAPDVDRIQLVAINFPKFADGRGYSSAVLLRTRFGYRGELRAIGDVGRDQLFYLRRCGFDAFALAPHRDPHTAAASLEDFTLRYQGSVDDPQPLFRKRLAAGGVR